MDQVVVALAIFMLGFGTVLVLAALSGRRRRRKEMTVREKIAVLIVEALDNAQFDLNGATLVLDLTGVEDGAAFFNLRVFGSDSFEGEVIVPVVTTGCESLDRYTPEGPSNG